MGRESFVRRRVLGKGLTHTYSRVKRLTVADDPSTPGTDESHDLWGALVTTHDVSLEVTGLPCSYTERQRLVRVAEGMVLVNQPLLAMPYDDPTDVGDWVLNIQDTEGTVLMAGPAAVEEVTPVAPSGPVVQKVATLRAVEVTE